MTRPHVVQHYRSIDTSVFLCIYSLFIFTCGQGRARAQSPRRAAPPQQPSRCNLRRGREVRQSGREVRRKAPQRCPHRHLHSVCVDFLIRCTYTGQRERAPSHCLRAPAGRRGGDAGGERWGRRESSGWVQNIYYLWFKTRKLTLK